jgi:flagellar biosynthetic protein FlhB
MAQNDPGRRTLPPTPQHRRRFREQGRVPRSVVIGPGAALMALPLVALLLWGAGSAAENLVAAGLSFTSAVASPAALSPLWIPVLVGPALVGISLLAWQGFSLVWPLRLQALNPIGGLSRLFSRQSLGQAALALAGLLALLGLAMLGIPQAFNGATLNLTLGLNLGVAGQALPALMAAAGGFGLVLVMVGGMTARARYERDLRMTPEEFREDLKAGEGDPLVRRRWMQIRRTFYQNRLRDAMRRADVVVANPTHYAVALAYEPWQYDAPVVVAKGRQLRALRIREMAEELQVPVVEAPPLARDLYHSVREGDMIPGRLYRAVAEILAYLYREHGYRPRRGPEEVR